MDLIIFKNMKLFSLILTFLLIQNILSVTFTEAMKNLEIAESYIKDYKDTHTTSYTLKHLVLCYIREGKYKSNTWEIAAGSCPSDLDSYVKERDSQANTKANTVRSYGEIATPSGDKIDFVHMFATMNGIEFGDSYTDKYSALVGWGGDTAQLAQDLKVESGTLEELVTIAKTKYLGIKGQFGPADLISDIDAPVILKKTGSNTFASTMRNYYNTNEYKDRVKNFLSLTFPGVEKSNLRDAVYKRYSSDAYIDVLECNYGLRSSFLGCLIPGSYVSQYKNHPKAANYAFADYLASNS